MTWPSSDPCRTGTCAIRCRRCRALPRSPPLADLSNSTRWRWIPTRSWLSGSRCRRSSRPSSARTTMWAGGCWRSPRPSTWCEGWATSGPWKTSSPSPWQRMLAVRRYVCAMWPRFRWGLSSGGDWWIWMETAKWWAASLSCDTGKTLGPPSMACDSGSTSSKQAFRTGWRS